MIKLRFILLSLLILYFLNGCVTQHQAQAKALRLYASDLSQNGEYERAINKAKQGLKRAQSSPVITQELIEAYDDLGLYHYQIKDFERSVYFQSVATVLSFFNSPSDPINKTYLQRLGFAYSKYIPGFNFSKISKSPLTLICGKGNSLLVRNSDIRRFLYKRTVIFSSKYNYRRYRLTSDACDTY